MEVEISSLMAQLTLVVAAVVVKIINPLKETVVPVGLVSVLFAIKFNN